MNTVRVPLVLAVALISFIGLGAQELKPPATNSSPPTTKGRLQTPLARPTEGKLLAVDKAARTLSVGLSDGGGSSDSAKRVLHIAANTVLIKNGKQVALADAVVGDPIRFYSKKNDERTETATLIIFGFPPGPAQPKPPSDPK